MVEHPRIQLPSDEVKNNIPVSKIAWQYQFGEMKRNLKPSKAKYMFSPPPGEASASDLDTTLQYYYCEFINDILRNIRAGEIDYCFYIYHIEDILKYEPRLKSRWLETEQCFRVWI